MSTLMISNSIFQLKIHYIYCNQFLSIGDVKMEKVYMDCAEDPDSNCSVKISGTKDEVMKVSMRHATEDHGYPDTPEVKQKLTSMIKAE